MAKKMLSVLCVIALSFSLALAENWPQWRGPLLNGVSNEKDLRLRWSREENIGWRLELPELR